MVRIADDLTSSMQLSFRDSFSVEISDGTVKLKKNGDSSDAVFRHVSNSNYVRFSKKVVPNLPFGRKTHLDLAVVENALVIKVKTPSTASAVSKPVESPERTAHEERPMMPWSPVYEKAPEDTPVILIQKN
jgi:hypothetical protein